MQYLNETGLNAFWKKIKDWTRSKHGQSIAKGTATEAGIPLNLMNGADTPTALGDTVTITKDDITKLGIPASDTKYAHPVGGAPSKAVGLYKFSTDATSHVTGVAAVTKADISPLESDPTVPAWAKEATKPDYDTDEIESASAGFHGDTLTVVIDKLDSAVETNAAAITKKQDAISDLAAIRSGAAKGATALQSVPSTYRTAAQQDAIHDGTKANIESPTFTGAPKAPTAPAGTNTTQVATCAFVHSEVAAASTGAAKYQGGMTAKTYQALTTYKQGWYWVVTETGTIAGESCEVGDMVFCNTDNSTAGTKKDSHFDIVQNNIDAIPMSVINALS